MSAKNTEAAFQQLRHNTRNTMQRIICLISEAPELADSPAGGEFAQNLINRICTSVDIADSLYCITKPSENIEKRLRVLGRSLITAFSERNQTIDFEVVVLLNPPEWFADIAMQIFHELIGNAITHGLSGKARGKITVEIEHRSDVGVTLTVEDSGSGFLKQIEYGQGLEFIRRLATAHGGQVILPAPQATTRITISFPKLALHGTENERPVLAF